MPPSVSDRTQPTVPEKPSLEGLEEKWRAQWEANRTYAFDRTKDRSEIFSIDTPPPTVSGSLHMGSLFGYVQQDTIARYHRMRGDEVFYPMGWDDNGVPTERRVQNYYGVRCDPSLPYDPEFTPPSTPADPPLPISRPNFIELCELLTGEDEQVFEDLWRRVGLSVDWTMTYTTIGEHARRVSQRAFLRNLARGEAYQMEAPTLWDVDFEMAVSQADLEDREQSGAYHRLRFAGPDAPIEIETTRPELIPACVALVAHPDDPRFQPLFGQEAATPLFGVRVPIVAHELADPDKGSGVAMICTFGDLTDVTWWRELGLPVRSIVQRDGRIQDAPPAGVADGDAWARLRGKTTKQARKEIVELLRESGELLGEPRAITHPVKFYERGDRPLEIVTSRQWFIRTMPMRDALLERGSELRWHPPHMRQRYEDWVDGLSGDWLISRQRFFGVPFPVWYPVGDDGEVDYERRILADEASLPVDPSTDAPAGYDAAQRGKPGGFIGDPDVMDTWATSSLTPQLVCGWEADADLFDRTFPMDLRPQGPEIIRTWLFYSVVRAESEHRRLPWRDTMINGWVLDPDRKKMSKSKGNVVTPVALLEQHGSDAVRYWAASGRPGTDTALDDNQFKIGRRLAIKLLNASKFVLARLGPEGDAVTAPLDAAMLSRLATVVDEVTTAFDDYDYARALERTESFFWSFCDDYLELVKGRAYGAHGEEAAASANRALTISLSTLLRLFAPFLPYVTEEIWSWWQEGSVHRSPWPTAGDLRGVLSTDGDEAVLDITAAVLGQVRRAKTDHKQSMKAAVRRVTVTAPAAQLTALRAAEGDLREAGNITDLDLTEGEALGVAVELA